MPRSRGPRRNRRSSSGMWTPSIATTSTASSRCFAKRPRSPPYTLWLRGPDAVRSWLLGRGIACRGSRLVPTAACGSPAFGQYHPGGAHGSLQPWAVIVLELADERIAAWHSFLDAERLFPLFGLPSQLHSQSRMTVPCS
jgi:hypothetical protein